MSTIDEENGDRWWSDFEDLTFIWEQISKLADPTLVGNPIQGGKLDDNGIHLAEYR